ncbi:recombinase family protein [Clostridium formicaceticum]|uniref:Recombinase family protein n=1 Tax=Clostridium formicaceticum TaxID=1497 RepID=A0AAC9WHL9_9CLOT|nr:recombinase family protein [Clostridium formicaceticum]AOY74717.1 recombinase family protein [Clostridium formicaceticum]ARE89101.1 Transposon Tn3 resolvase [Clostridium formicaceticum]
MTATVQVIKANKTFVNRKLGQTLEQIRVAPYCRVSTDSEDQAKSYKSQIKYYSDLVKEKKEWVLVDIYADEAITGTRDDKRSDFLRMIEDCKKGLIDMIITKSIARFARNTVDTLRYVRMLKEMGIAVYFEEENINTLTMDGELLLTILASVAQQAVENTSADVKKGLKMKMKRGELVGFNSCLGYDYDKEAQTISINETEAIAVRYIYGRYLEGAGAFTIARELNDLKYKTKNGSTKWHDSSVRKILKNEKYKGDLLQGKTFTIDPITKRRLENFGEEDKFYCEDHHQAIISREDWDEVQRIMQVRGEARKTIKGTVRQKLSRQYAFSSKLECAFCGTNFSRRSWNANTPHQKTTWQCVTSTKKGKKYCEHSKGIPETVVEGAFMKSFALLVRDKSKILDEFLERVEQSFNDNSSEKKVKQIEKRIDVLKKKISKLTDLYLEEAIEKKEYQTKYTELNKELDELVETYEDLNSRMVDEIQMKKRIRKLKNMLEADEIVTEFDRQVFENLIEKVVVGEIDENGSINPYKLTFIYRTGLKDKINPPYDGSKKRKKKSSDVVCSDQANDVKTICSDQGHDTCGNCR